MSDVNLVFTVSSVTSAITVDTTTVNVTPNTTAINMFAGYAAYPPNGATGNSQVLFNDAGLFGGEPEFTYTKSTETLNITNLIANGTSNLGYVGNVKISGGSAGQFLTSQGSGDVAWSTLTPGGNTTELQFNNDGEFGGIPTVTYSDGNLLLGNTSTVKIAGGTNGYVLQTDGTGNLTWTAQIAGEPGNGVPGGSNSQVQFNNAGLFGGAPGFTFDNVSNVLTVANIVSGNISGNLSSNTQNSITQLGALTSLTVEGTTKIQQGKEKITNLSNTLPLVYDFNVLDQAIVYYTNNSTRNTLLNIRGNSTTTFDSITNDGESVTLAFLMKNGNTSYSVGSTISIDNQSITPKWSGNISPSTSGILTTLTNSVVSYSYTIIKLSANTYSVLASLTGYK